MPPISEPGYEFTKVPAWKLDQNFVVVKAGREETFKSLAELLLCCNEAVQRQHKRPSHKRGPKRPYHAGKPLLLEYMSDRVDIDDPLGAYMVRTKDEGWLQGFVTYTTFTTWHKDFRWDSLDANAEMDVHSVSNKGRVLDLDASLSRKLQAQVVLCAPPIYTLPQPLIRSRGLLHNKCRHSFARADARLMGRTGVVSWRRYVRGAGLCGQSVERRDRLASRVRDRAGRCARYAAAQLGDATCNLAS